MSNQYVKVKNKNTGLFLYGFGLGETYKQTVLDIGHDLYDDVDEEQATWYDLNNSLDNQYIQENVTSEHEVIQILEK